MCQVNQPNKTEFCTVILNNKNMKVLIFGATGIVGKAILNEALNQQHQVTVLTRDKSKISIINSNLTIVEGNVMDRKTLNEVLNGQDAVIQSLGIGGKGDGKPTSFVSNVNNLIMEEMKKNNVQRLIAISVIGAGNSIAFMPKIFTKFIIPYFMKWFQAVIDDKNRMEPMIINSNLDWTIIRGTTIVDKPAKNKITTTLDGKGIKFSITSSDFALFVVNQLSNKTYLKQLPTVSN